MEYKCEYCKEPFLPKRSDSLYCSHSCRQLAYVLRKASSKAALQSLQAAKVNEVKVLELSDDLDNYLPEREDILTGNLEDLALNKKHPSIIDEQNNQTSRQESGKMEKELSVRTDTDIIDKENKLSVRTDINAKNKDVNTDNKLPVKISIENLETNKKIPVKTDKASINTVKAEKQEQEIPKPQYKEYSSRYLDELDKIHAERDNWMRLDHFFGKRDNPSFWVSEKYRCLVECLLTLSEMKQIELDDLKEVCNAFTRLIQSRNFRCLHPNYPYTDEISKLRDRIKNICIKAGDREWLKYRLSKEEKQNLIITRFDLSQFVPKRKFSELNFKEKENN